MFFRFVTALALVVLISLAGAALEKRNLDLKRAVSRQHYRLLVLERECAARRLVAQQQGAPSRLVGALEPEALSPPAAKPAPPPRPAGPKKQRQSGKTAAH